MGIFDSFRKSVTIRRKSTGAYINYKWVEDTTPVDIIIQASVQPVGANEMQQLPEGRRTNETFKMYTDIKLRTVDEQNPDDLFIDGERFEVISVASYQSNVINHYKIIIQKTSETR